MQSSTLCRSKPLFYIYIHLLFKTQIIKILYPIAYFTLGSLLVDFGIWVFSALHKVAIFFIGIDLFRDKTNWVMLKLQEDKDLDPGSDDLEAPLPLTVTSRVS